MGGASTAVRLIVADFVVSFMWVWAGILIKMFVYDILDMGSHEPTGEMVKGALSILEMFLFAFLEKITEGGSYNPLMILPCAISGDFSHFLFTAGARIPAQVMGSITGVRYIIATFPEIGSGPRLSIGIHRAALTEGFLAFVIVVICLGLARKIPGSFYTKTWISSVSKLTLHILGSDLTGGVMNPASEMGWAHARGNHTSKEHIVVYWLAPLQATLLAVWAFERVVQPQKQEEKKVKSEGKSD